ncbi:ABC transporter permease [Leucothrix sargassi]|nr:ABC transporter permease [Leucothrix sargassi]
MTKHQNVGESYSRQILRTAFSGWGAKIGFMWVMLLAFVACFAPFLANSAPLLVSQNGEISMPIIRFLAAEDVMLAAVFIGLLLLWWIPLSVAKKFWVLLVIAVVSLLLGYAFLSQPKIIVYEQFREQIAAGVYDWAVMPVVPYSPSDYLRDVGDTALLAPSYQGLNAHFMGTDSVGSDVASRMIHASRVALSIGFIATGIAIVIGIIIGGQMGYFAGRFDMIGMRLVEIFEAIPVLFLLLAFVAFFGRSVYILMIIIGVTGWSGYARYVRAEFLKLRKQDYVQAAIASGLSLRSILFRHMLPNGVAPVLVVASFGVASAILTEATLSFLGLGPVEAPSWGGMLNEAVKSSVFNWWMAVFPGGAIFLTVFSYNLIGEALRDAVDPQLARKAGVAS